jgi:hypothetical protein
MSGNVNCRHNTCVNMSAQLPTYLPTYLHTSRLLTIPNQFSVQRVPGILSPLLKKPVLNTHF